jgi:hypothetical protein
MSTAVLIVNIVLAAFVFAGVVGFLAWSITRGQRTGVEGLRTRQGRSDISTADEQVGGAYAADQAIAVG